MNLGGGTRVWRAAWHKLSGKSGWSLLCDNSLLLHDSSLSLRDIAITMWDELKPRIISVSNHRTKAEKCGRRHRSTRYHRNCNCSGEIQNRPSRTENQFNEYPWNSKESFDDVKQIEQQQCTGEPEPGHCNKVEVRRTRQSSVTWKNYA